MEKETGVHRSKVENPFDNTASKKMDPYFEEFKSSTSFFSVSSPDTIEKFLLNQLKEQNVEVQSVDENKYKIKMTYDKNQIRFKILKIADTDSIFYVEFMNISGDNQSFTSSFIEIRDILKNFNNAVYKKQITEW